MDAFGPRPALDGMAERLAGEGYVVLVPDLFYRNAPYGPFDARTAFAVEPTATQLRGMLASTTQVMTQADTGAFLDALDREGATGPIGAVGYCMGGARALNLAAEVGSLEPGKWADCTVIRLQGDAAPAERVLASGPADVLRTFVGGREVYRAA